MSKKLRKISPIGTVSSIITSQFVPEKFMYSYAQMVQYNTKHFGEKEIYYDKIMSSWLPKARNDAVKQMYGDWIFFIDADLEFEADSLVRMLRIMEKYDAPVLTGVYPYKRRPHFPLISTWNQERKTYEAILEWPKDTEIFQVDAAGAGCLLVKKWVFGYVFGKTHQEPFDVMNVNSEDISFFNRLREVGVGVYCTPQVQFGHLNTDPIWYDADNFYNIKNKEITLR